MKKLIVGLCCVVLPSLAMAQQAATGHLVISEVAYDTVDETGSTSEYVEIHNPTNAAIDLNAGADGGMRYFISDSPIDTAATPNTGGYWRVVNGNVFLGGVTSDFVYEFPAGTTIPANGTVIVTHDADAFLGEFFGGSLAAFQSLPGSPILLEVTPDVTADSIPNMILRSEYTNMAITPPFSFTNGGEGVVLFRWDGASDLVQDVDAVFWGTSTAQFPVKRVSGAAVSIDGPDADATASTYQTDPVPTGGPTLASNMGNLQRLSILEPSETGSGNGIGGHQEMSESFQTADGAWLIAAHTPGRVFLRVDSNVEDAISFLAPAGTSPADGPGPGTADFGADGTLTELYVRAIDSTPDGGYPQTNDALYVAVRGSMFGEAPLSTNEANGQNASFVLVDVDPTGTGGVKRLISSGNQLSDTSGGLDSRITSSGFQLPATYGGGGFDLAIGLDTHDLTANTDFGIRAWGTGGIATGTTSDFAYLGALTDFLYDTDVSTLLPGKAGTTYAAEDGFEAILKFSEFGINPAPAYVYVVAVTTNDLGTVVSPNTVPESSGNLTTRPHTLDNGACVEVATGRVVVRYADIDGDGHGGTTKVCAALGANVSDRTGDCDDNDAARFPGNPEVCDGKDNNCAGGVDEGLTFRTYYVDADNDTYGSTTSISSCQTSPPSGHSANNTDCNDTVATINPGATEVCDPSNVDEDCDGQADDLDTSGAVSGKTTYYRDQDSDTYGNPAQSLQLCDAPASGYVTNNGDCDDTDGTISPAGTEACDGKDNNCNGAIDEGVSTAYYRDQDSDLYGDPATVQNACAPPSGFVTNNTDCNDTNANIKPGQPEACNGIDDDCDTQVDEGLTLTSWYPDTDSDMYGAGTAVQACSAPPNHVSNNTDCNDGNNAIRPGATEIPGDSIDQNCDAAEICYVDADSDDFRAPGTATIASTDTDCNDSGEGRTTEPATDCADTNAAVNPGAAEIPGDGVDQNCDAAELCFADADNDGYRPNSTATVASTDLDCADANEAVGTDPTTDCDDTVATVNPAGTETCNSADDNCNGTIDEGVKTTFYVDADGDGVGGATTQAACAQPTGYVTTSGDCDDSDLNVKPNATETCDTKDNDCDGTVDEDVKTTFYVDADGDGAGGSGTQQACAAPTGYVATQNDCDDADADKKPAGTEVCDGKDNNCNGTTDEGVQTTFYVDADGDGQGGQSSVSACTAPAGHSANKDDCNDGDANVKKAAKEEACTDTLDNDCDGKTDSDDSDDCEAAPIDPEPACGCSSGTQAAFAPMLLIGLALLRRRRT